MTIGTLLVLVLALGWDVQPAWCATPAEVRLVELARSKFANLTKAELALLRFVGANPGPGGGFAAAGPSSNPNDPSNDPAHADEWTKDREVRAALIRWLCVDPEAIRCIDPEGLRLLGAKVVGGLNLSEVRVPFAITLRNCSIPPFEIRLGLRSHHVTKAQCPNRSALHQGSISFGRAGVKHQHPVKQ